MKAAAYTENGPPSVLRYIDVPDPALHPQGVIIRVEAVSIEGGDTLNRAGGALDIQMEVVLQTARMARDGQAGEAPLLVTCLCAKSRGKLTLFGKTLHVFPEGFNSLLLYFICILWAIVLVACLIFGSGFAFYAMFAAIAIELIGAVYYTFQLK